MVTIVGYNGDGGDIMIPSEINGKKVTCVCGFGNVVRSLEYIESLPFKIVYDKISQI
ncbi:MAG: hypothetical protein HFI84_02700 [Eubacterium sp.]|nr:hypothetical protein [Eubacterium sp.]